MKKSAQQIVLNPISRTTAEHALVRSLQFLRTVGTDSTVLAAMQKTGFRDADLKQGWALVLAACSTATRFDTTPVSPVVDATKKITEWQSIMFVRTRAALHRLHPEQETFVFDNLVAGEGVSAVVAVAIFLDRCTALESSPERKATRKADHAALATLEIRGVTADGRKQIGQMVHFVENSSAPVPEERDVTVSSARMQALIALHAWIQDWTDCARTVITRRDHLLRLGIGKRRAPTPRPPAVVVTAVATPAPLVAEARAGRIPSQLTALNGEGH